MNGSPGDWVLFLGRFHPVLVHLPIGALLLLGALELLARCSSRKGAAQSRSLILALAAAGVLIAATCGWLLSQSGEYDRRMVQYHKWSGLALAGACLLAAWFSRFPERWPYRLSLAATLALVLVAGHLGGSLTHGPTYLTRYAPPPLRTFLDGHFPALTASASAKPQTAVQLLPAPVRDVLDRHCIACHGPEKQKGELRLDSRESLLRGGELGPVIVPGHAAQSLLVRRLLLPEDEDDHMPPATREQLTSPEIETLRQWIDAGAPAAQTGAGPQRAR